MNEPSIDITPQVDSAEWAEAPLYAAFFGLTVAPFDLTPNPRFVFLTERHREVYSNVRYALTTPKGFTLVLGEAGTGKTTLIRTALAGLVNTPHRFALVTNPTLSRQEFYEVLADAFGLDPRTSESKPRFLAALQRDVEDRRASGGLTGLIVDEAQSLPHELLEELRLLGNIETSTTKLLNIVLGGQPELADRLNEPSLRQLKQRIALRCQLEPLSLADTAAYMSGRLKLAGGSPGQIFSREAVIATYEGARGIPRSINVIADNALINAFAAQVKPVPVEIVRDVCRDFDLGPGPSTEAREPWPSVSTTTALERPATVEPGAVVRKRRFSYFS